MPPTEPTGRRWWMWLIWGAAAAAGLKFGFDFGLSIGGVWMGLAMAFMTALFGTMLADGVVLWLLRLTRGRADQR